jgi:imidazolonepropionase-like amidohydrolase
MNWKKFGAKQFNYVNTDQKRTNRARLLMIITRIFQSGKVHKEMKKIFALMLIIILPTLIFGQVSQTAKNRLLVFRNVTLIDMRSDAPQANMTVVVKGNRISKIGKNIKPPKNAEVIDASGKFLMPGLWDNYTFTLEAVKNEFPYFEMMIAHGVTGVRDAGTTMDLAEAERLQNEINAGRILAPRLFYAGRIINGTNISTQATNEPWRIRMSLQTKDADEAVRNVEMLARNGADYISIASYFPPELVPTVVAAAKKHDLPVLGFIVFGYAEASNAGVGCFEHFADLYRSTSTKRNEVYALYRDRRLRTMTADEVYKIFSTLRETRDQKYYDETLRTLARNKTCVITNFAEQGHSKEIFEFTDASRRRFKTQKQLEQLDAAIKEKQRQRSNQDYRASDTAWKGLLQDISDLHKAGVPLLAGTQSVHEDFTTPGVWLHDELYWFVQAGLSPFEALKTATVNSAKFMRREKDLGTIETGKLADLILLNANPLTDISNTRKINAVVANGRYLSRKFLDKMLADVEAAAKEKK